MKNSARPEFFFLIILSLLFPALLHAEENGTVLNKAHLSREGELPVLILEGGPYEIGFQHGTLLKKEVRQATDQMLDYFPKKLKVPLLGKLIVNFWLDRAYRKIKKNIPPEYEEEMWGLSDGSGVSLRKIHRLHAVPDLYSTLCASGAFFGKATKDGRLYQFRNLDWNREIGIQDYACVFLIKKEGKIPFLNAGYTGFIGVLSGMNLQGISVAQIGSSSKDETLKGTPMPFLLRRILEEAKDAEAAVDILRKADRTVGYNYVLADAQQKKAFAVETTEHHFAVFHENDPAETQSPHALRLENGVMRADFAVDVTIRDLQKCAAGVPKRKGLEDPHGSGAYDKRYKGQYDFAKEHYGKIDENVMKELARTVAPRSNVQSVIYAFPKIWIANAQGELPAAQTEYLRFDITEIVERTEKNES